MSNEMYGRKILGVIVAVDERFGQKKAGDWGRWWVAKSVDMNFDIQRGSQSGQASVMLCFGHVIGEW